VQKRLFTISGSRSTYDDVRVLEFGKIFDQNSFYPKMAIKVAEELEALHRFESESLNHLSIDPNKGDSEEKQRDLLLKVNSCIYDFKMKSPAIDLQIDVLKDCIGLLAKNGINMEKSEIQMNEAVDKWAAVKKQAPIAKDLGKTVQEREAFKIKKNIENFENRAKTYAFEFSKKPLFDYTTGVDPAYTNVAKIREELLKLDSEMADLASYARIFEFPDLIDPARAVQERCHSELQMTLQLWHMIDFINFQLGDWKKTLWHDINCEVFIASLVLTV
jgi:dynein heavy chain